MRKIYEQILLAFDIDMVHIQHSQDLSLELYFASERFGIPVIATIHDFYYACPTIILLDNENQFCQKEDAKLPLKRGRNAAGMSASEKRHCKPG